jgi:polar amino acid transport system substrate-binding protein
MISSGKDSSASLDGVFLNPFVQGRGLEGPLDLARRRIEAEAARGVEVLAVAQMAVPRHRVACADEDGVGLYRDFAPYSYMEGGELKGVDVEIGRLIADGLGVDARFEQLTADEDVDSDLRNYVWRGHYMGGRVVNVMMRVPYDRELEIRNELAALTGQYANERLAIAYRIADVPDDGPLPEAFLGRAVAVENHTISDFYLSALMGGQLIPNMRRARTLYAARALLDAGEVDAVIAPRAQLEHALPEGFAVHAPPLPGLAHAEWCIGIAVRFSYKMLGYAVDDVIRAAVGDGRIAAIYAAHGLTYAPPTW